MHMSTSMLNLQFCRWKLWKRTAHAGEAEPFLFKHGRLAAQVSHFARSVTFLCMYRTTDSHFSPLVTDHCTKYQDNHNHVHTAASSHLSPCRFTVDSCLSVPALSEWQLAYWNQRPNPSLSLHLEQSSDDMCRSGNRIGQSSGQHHVQSSP